MAVFEDRQKTFEGKFVRDQEHHFNISVKQTRLLALWAAEAMALSSAETDLYVDALIEYDLAHPGSDDVVGKVVADLTAKWIVVSDLDIRRRLAAYADEARRVVEARAGA